MIKWEQQQKGWFTSDIGGVCREKNGWWFWPSFARQKVGEMIPRGPFKTATEAKQVAERRGNERS